MTRQVEYWAAAPDAPDAVSAAKAMARDDGLRVVTVARVKWQPKDGRPGWTVTLAVRP